MTIYLSVNIIPMPLYEVTLVKVMEARKRAALENAGGGELNDSIQVVGTSAGKNK